ncbi:MAG: arylsulfatase [Planctomycetota bacterium]
MGGALEKRRHGCFHDGMLRCLLALAVVFAPLAVAQDLPQKPNIIYIMCDDLGYGDLSCFGQKMVPTPNLDQLAREGMRFTDFYAGCTVCRPSRLSLWTGQHMGHTAISSNAGYHFKPEDVTVAELMKDVGYKTGGVGKWAMGGVGTSGFPLKNGFDFWMGYLDQGQAHNYYPEHLWRNGDKFPLAGNVLSDHRQARGRVAKTKVTWSHSVMTDQAFGFIEENKDNPFLLHIHWTIPHANNEGGRVYGDGMEVPDYGIYKDRDWPNTAKGQAAMITWMDKDVGRLCALLRKLKIDRKTLVIFTSDNGPHSEGGHKHEFFDANGPLRGFKRDLYEGGIRVPTIAWWPGVIEPESTCAEPLAFWDFLPTACELAGAKTPPGIDGLSFVNALRGQKQKSHGYLYWKFGNKEAVRAGKWKAVRLAPGKAIELYDLRKDLGEKKNIAPENPEVVKWLGGLMAEAVK